MWWERTGHLNIQNNRLFIRNQLVSDLAKKHGTPLYIYNAKRIIDNYNLLEDALKSAGFNRWQIYYAMKANNHPEVLRIIKKLDAGIDATSPGEISLARRMGFEDSKIIFTGTSLSNSDLEYLLKTNVLINFDSISSIKRFKSKQGRKVGLRINTGIGLGRTPKVSTGGAEVKGLPVKFGLSGAKIFEAIDVIVKKKLEIYCIHHHVGSDWLSGQINDYFRALENLLEITDKIKSKLGCIIPVLDLGGGFGVPHSEDEKEFPIYEFFQKVAKIIAESKLNFSMIIIEPGNFIVGDAGILVAQVNTVEEKNDRIFIGVDMGLNVFNSPALYDFYHEIVICDRYSDVDSRVVTVAGNICETGDLFAVDRKLPKIEEGDYIAILNAGAYGSVISSKYNLRPNAKEVILK